MMIFERVEDWMFNVAMPFWREHGVDRAHGGFVEQMTFDGADAGVGFKRTRVTGRQIYVFSHAVIAGRKEALDEVSHGLDFLLNRQFIDNDKGFVRCTDRYGDVIDDTPDLYDYAFVLFALSWAFRATSDRNLLGWMHRTLDLAEKLLRHPNGKGFWHDATKRGWRQQNPHMHLLEASLAAVEATGEDRFKTIARDVALLFRDQFFQRSQNVLPEFFDDEWMPADDPSASFAEPGHQFEWAWILMNAKRLIGLDMDEEARALVAFGERYGVDPVSRAAYNRVAFDGTPIDRGSRSWPNTERLKAAVAMFEIDGQDPMPVFEQSAGLLLDRYLATHKPGLWIDKFDAEGRSMSETVPASTLYHIGLAFLEMLRIRDNIQKGIAS